ncbi:hypothetical protein EUGRSUZ_D01253 [Eucalyptus grandis]|uniref:Uncharacterized protein n=2 Tax=Eucalyptus grandis TaxID=71139 RepID=A0ACC3L7F5_EUCGR|nr:hypothetical protein EUGRSUZ_D01253 [Eucalyptus grandis]
MKDDITTSMKAREAFEIIGSITNDFLRFLCNHATKERCIEVEGKFQFNGNVNYVLVNITFFNKPSAEYKPTVDNGRF